MTIHFQKKSARMEGVVGVEEAEGLLDWLQRHPDAKINLASCTHLHAANLQVLMALRPTLSVWPGDASLKLWLQAALPAY
ncbi:hypothetical protein DJ564_24550 [Pseudomonas sp. 31-12]|uniref:hypothetical protein n=1 Tax=Pseudomonas sp. 31-12 TaxID=2201356 RepID=UPI000D6AEC89|nr:hypothetical protein [Pseudomonas sp. 31-12]AWM93730.1 hypothetical protein DJ564_24550 [Pseudomonas sp. 31-12]